MTETDNTGKSDDNCPDTSTLSSHPQSSPVIQEALDLTSLVLSFLLALFLTSKLLATLHQPFVIMTGLLCFVVAALLSRVIIARTFGGSPWQGVRKIILETILGVFYWWGA